MKQIIQYQKTGVMKVDELPIPVCKDGWVLVKNYFSLISSGTEKTSVETAQASMIGKAKSRPDLVKQVIQNVKREGLMATYEKVKTRLDSYKELGYSSAGVVVESGVDTFKQGEFVACAGATANHSEYVLVPKNLCVKVPEGVAMEEAAFTTLGSIAMQGIRQADLSVGENVAVIGLGLLGLITVQLAKISGCNVIGLDVNEANFGIAKKLGCDICLLSNEDSILMIDSFTMGTGTDSVIITAGTKSNEPLELALNFARKKSSVVVVGAVGMNVPRSPFYEKEIDLKISCSYGPGRYDSDYEEFGLDYPIGYVRWTENRNMQSIVDLIRSGKLNVKDLITHKIPIDDGLSAYDIITGKVQEKYLAVLIEYPNKQDGFTRKIELKSVDSRIRANDKISVGFIGAGNFAQSYLIPPLKDLKINFAGVCTSEPVNAKSVADKFGFGFCTTDYKEIINNKDINTVFIATRHDSHGGYVLEALKAGKNVYVEKPLTIDYYQLSIIKEILEEKRDFTTENTESTEGKLGKKQKDFGHLMVGFNRRFSKSFVDIKKFFENMNEPYVVNYRVHAGFIPKKHWIQFPNQGGRIIGEGCHFIDTMQFITRSKPISVYARCIDSMNSNVNNYDNVVITIEYADGSVGNLLYLANGDSAVPKEYCEIYSGGKTAVMNNFKENLYFSGNKKSSKKFDGRKGHKEEIVSFINAIKGNGELGISFESIYDTTMTTFKAMESLRSGEVVRF